MIYKFRAECIADVTDLIFWIPIGDVIAYKRVKDLGKLPDIEIEIELKNTNLEKLRKHMNNVKDGHVMAQTVMPIEKYTGERNYEL